MDLTQKFNADLSNIIEAAIDIEKPIENLTKIAEQLHKSADCFLNKSIRKILSDFEAGNADLIDQNDWQHKFENFQKQSLCRIHSLYYIYENSRLNKLLPANENALDDAVEIENSGDILIVKTPHLLNRNTIYYNASSGTHPINYLTFYSYEVDRKMEKCDKNIKHFQQKNITVLSVYSDDRKDIPDAENLDSKKIIDAITRYFPGTDSGETTSIFQLCIKNSMIQEGAYFIVTEGFAKTPELSAIIKLLKSEFAKPNRI